MTMHAQFRRRYRLDETPVPFTLNGMAETGLRGDTVLTAILSVSGRLRQSEFSGEDRAGFCLIGACQDCYVMLANGSRIRACSTALEPGMTFITDMRAAAKAAHE
ncbi:MAG TPA: (2Fe-2S)-binding protein [Ensifer sp.]|jgi:predicted molibdopterin-dependent oxidoreductase YjgC|uniref:(2Fe-2S)-binding protein n=1 Tax=Ensifer sp. TaxID=1872086 RepID=UPI002E12519D|nr:(2Fe-2S)-binding protein [Ensifer sp.]